jgi:NitT/TauT family transport system substrate-binding protein
MRPARNRPAVHRLQRRSLGIAAAALLTVSLLGNTAVAQPRDSFKIAWSIYVGWMPWGYGEAEGIVKRWADKYDISIEVVQINDYVESINLYTAGSFDGVALTNMDALTIPAAGGVDTTALILSSTSNGNDGIVLKGASGLAAIKGRDVNLVELSVSHYLLARGLESVGLTERDIKVVNTSDADIVSVAASPDVTAVVAWKPQLSEISAAQGSHLVFDSAKIPGEIIDTLSVNTEVLAANPNLGKALVGAWYEIMQRMSAPATGRAARTAMGEASGTDLAGYEEQLATTQLFATPADAMKFASVAQLRATMDSVRKFAFEHGLLGENASSVDFVGIGFADGSVLGNPSNVRLRFNTDYVKLAAEGKL